jgi:hypothetical protein
MASSPRSCPSAGGDPVDSSPDAIATRDAELTPERNPTWSLRVRVRYRRTSIDHQLARGASPSTSPALALRAHQLAGARERRAIAVGLETILAAAAEAQRDSASRLVLDHVAVSEARPEIIALIERLRNDRTPRVRGIALSRLLALDRRSPLLHTCADQPLMPALADIFDTL